MDHSQSQNKSGHSDQAIQIRSDAGGLAITREKVTAAQSPPGLANPGLSHPGRGREHCPCTGWADKNFQKPLFCAGLGTSVPHTLSQLSFIQCHDPSRSCSSCKEKDTARSFYRGMILSALGLPGTSQLWKSPVVLQTLLLYHHWVNLNFTSPNLYSWHKSQVILQSSASPSPVMAQAAAVAGLENIKGKFKSEGTSRGL